MGQKIHPLGLRLGITQKHRSIWFAKSKHYPSLIIEDYFLRKTLLNRFGDAGITEIEIYRKLDQIKIEIQTARPGVFVGRDGTGLEALKKDLEKLVLKHRSPADQKWKQYSLVSQKPDEEPSLPVQIAIHVTELANPDSEAGFIADFLVEQLEKRVAFRRAVRQAIQRAQRARVQGIKIQISGRLNGAEIARTEWVREGRVPLQTLRADLGYSYQTAKTIYGLLGIKVWVFKGELVVGG